MKTNAVEIRQWLPALIILSVGLLSCNKRIITGNCEGFQFGPDSTAIDVRIGNPVKLRGDDAFGIPRGRYPARITHTRGTCSYTYKTNSKGEISKKINFQTGDELHFYKKGAGTVKIVNNAAEDPSTKIEVSISKHTKGRIVYGELKGKALRKFRHDFIEIWADGKYVGTLDALYRYAVSVDTSRMIMLTFAINNYKVLDENGGNLSEFYDCGICSVYENCCNYVEISKCCNICYTTLSCQSITINDKDHARVDLSFDDDQKMKRIMRLAQLREWYDQLHH